MTIYDHIWAFGFGMDQYHIITYHYYVLLGDWISINPSYFEQRILWLSTHSTWPVSADTGRGSGGLFGAKKIHSRWLPMWLGSLMDLIRWPFFQYFGDFISGWWFLNTTFMTFHIGNSNPNWLSYFSEGFKPPTSDYMGYGFTSKNIPQA